MNLVPKINNKIDRKWKDDILIGGYCSAVYGIHRNEGESKKLKE